MISSFSSLVEFLFFFAGGLLWNMNNFYTSSIQHKQKMTKIANEIKKETKLQYHQAIASLDALGEAPTLLSAFCSGFVCLVWFGLMKEMIDGRQLHRRNRESILKIRRFVMILPRFFAR